MDSNSIADSGTVSRKKKPVQIGSESCLQYLKA